jgi:hypothetical protein
MPSVKAAPAPYFTDYEQAWKVCAELWPLLVGRFIYILLNYGAFFLCLLLTCWPVISGLYQAAQGGSRLGSSDYQSLFMDFFERFKDLGFLGAVFGVFFFYLIWWTVISAWFNGGLYGRLTAFVEQKKRFTWSAFIQDGFYHLIPMVLLQGLLGTVFLLIGGLVFVIGFLGVMVYLAFFHSSALLLVLLAILLVLVTVVFVLFLLSYQVFSICAQASLMEDGRVGAAFKDGYEYCLENRGRILKVMAVMMVGLWAAFLLFLLVFWVLELIPILGIIFLLISLVVRLAFYIMTDVYFPALAVGLISKAKR